MGKKPADVKKIGPPELRKIGPLTDEEYRKNYLWYGECPSLDSLYPLIDLIALDTRAAVSPGEQNPYDALTAVQLACRLGLPAPPWAARLFDQLLTRRLMEPGATLDCLFGYTQSGTGAHKRGLVFQALLKARNAALAYNVFRLTVLGCTKEEAVRKVAVKLLKEKGWNKTAYPIELGRDSRQLTPEERLEATEQSMTRIYKQWRRANGSVVNDQSERAGILASRTSILANFPTD
jgi:hypothetical protein